MNVQEANLVIQKAIVQALLGKEGEPRVFLGPNASSFMEQHQISGPTHS